MPLPNIPFGIETQANAVLAALVIDLAAKQETYKSTNHRYWQGIRSHAAVPRDGSKVAPDKTRKPTDQIEDWNVFGVSLPSTMEIATTVDVYKSPTRHGYTVSGEIEIAGKTYIKTIHVKGNETWRAHDWLELAEDEI